MNEDEILALYEMNREIFSKNAAIFNKYQSKIAQQCGAGLCKIISFLSGHMDYRCFVVEISVSSICSGVAMSKSTVQAHLAKGRNQKLIQTEKVLDLRTGRTIALRFRFPDFIKNLSHDDNDFLP
jgi:hypothetical protein